MTHISTALALRAKILGTLVKDARRTKGQNIEDCAQAIGITPEIFQDYESGRQAPSLPELEGLAYFLEIPIEHFWSNQTLETPTKSEVDIERLRQIRQRIIGAMLHQSRLDTGLSLEQISQITGLHEDHLSQYELGKIPIPITELESICEGLNRSVKEFIDRQSPIGMWNLRQQTALQFMEMPAALQSFVSKPINRPYLDLAQKLSNMSVEKLRSVAEILLEITY